MFGSRNQGVKGHIIIDGEHTADTWQCVHCGAHWQVKIGSGTSRGFCHHCMGPLCGKEECMKNCLPFENWLELNEKGTTKLKVGQLGVLRKISIKDRPIN